MEWFANLSTRWQRVIIAVVVVMLLVGIEGLQEMVQTEEASAESLEGKVSRFLFEENA